MAEAKIEGSINEWAFLATKSYKLSYITNKDQNGDEAPTWLLTWKPITNNDEKHREYPKIIHGTKFFVRIYALLLEEKFVNCVWCKSDTHPGHQCPLPWVEDWRGPKPPTKMDTGGLNKPREEQDKVTTTLTACRKATMGNMMGKEEEVPVTK